MRQWLARLKRRDVACGLWVGLCFALTSAVYISWFHRLLALTGNRVADWISMVAGYLLQAAGTAVVALMLRRDPPDLPGRRFAGAALLFAAVCAPALLSPTPAGAACFGGLMNLFCGGIAGYYLYTLDLSVPSNRQGLAFGGGYAMATVAVGLLALAGGGRLIHGSYALLIYLPLALALPPLTAWLGLLRPSEAAPASETEAWPRRRLALACAVVLLASAVKNLGFAFPSEDVSGGLSLELSRVPYAVGLAAAGWISDRSRRRGMLCTVAALVLPFLMLGLAGEPVPRAICWGLDYLFYGFFSVFRVVLFLDIAARTHRSALAPMGLVLGRLGDVAGTAVSLALGDHRIALIAVTALLFFPTLFLFFRLYQGLFEPEAARQRSEQEVFEAFCLHNDLSARERDVLRMVVADHTNGEIAEALFITESTVKYHVRNVLQKTGCKNRGELQRKYASALYPQLHLEAQAAKS